MIFLYNIGIRVYGFLIYILSPFHNKVKQLYLGRKIKTTHFSKQDKPILVHCSSLGEYEQAVPILKKIRELDEKRKIIISFSSPSGYENKKDNYIGDYICYLPLDTKSKMEKFIESLNPEIVLIIKYEFWPNLFLELKRKSIPVYSVSSIFRNNHYLFKYFGNWNLKIIKDSVTHFFVQDQESKKNLQKNNISNVSVVGDTRYDRVLEIFENKKEIELIKIFKGQDKLLVCGSTWPKDIDLILGLIKRNPRLKIIIAPHELIHLQKLNIGLRFSSAKKENITQNNILIIDSIGLLSSLYKYGDIAYVGGGFDKGIHNTLEAICHGIPVIFGPKYKKYREANSMVKEGYAKSISNEEELTKAFDYFNENPVNSNIKLFCTKNSGATNKIIDFIFS